VSYNYYFFLNVGIADKQITDYWNIEIPISVEANSFHYMDIQ